MTLTDIQTADTQFALSIKSVSEEVFYFTPTIFMTYTIELRSRLDFKMLFIFIIHNGGDVCEVICSIVAILLSHRLTLLISLPGQSLYTN